MACKYETFGFNGLFSLHIEPSHMYFIQSALDVEAILKILIIYSFTVLLLLTPGTTCRGLFLSFVNSLFFSSD